MTLTTALLALRERLDEATAAAWDDTMLTRWINEGQTDLCQRTECLQTVTTIPVTAGVQVYSLTQAIVRIHRLDYTPTGTSELRNLEYRDFNAMDSVWYTQGGITSNTPIYYTLWGYPPDIKLILYPIPPTAGVLSLRYYALPTAVSAGSDNLSVPTGWESAVLDYAEAMALRRDLQPRWQEAMGLYERNVDKLMDLSRRWTDQAGVIDGYTGGGAYGLPGWLVNG